MAYISGIDVSVVQGSVDWNAVAASGVAFAIIKCYEGNDGIDSMFSANIAGAQAAGLKTAAYNVVYPLPTNNVDANRDPVDQATLHYNASAGQILCVDVEWPAPQDWSTWGINASFINQWLISYMQQLSKLSAPRSPIIYSYPDYVTAVGFSQELAQYPYWAASYDVSTPEIPAPFTDWLIWQYGGGTGKLPDGAPVDQNYVRDLSLWDV